jgi:hypothetical protein
VFVVAEPVKAMGLTHWRAPFTGGFECTIPVGTTLVAVHDQADGAEGLAFRPEGYEEMERLLVPEEDRAAEKYDGYSLVVLLAEIGTKLLVADESDEAAQTRAQASREQAHTFEWPPMPKPRWTYALRLRLPDGSEKDSGNFTTGRKRASGDLVNLPDGPEGRSSRTPTTGYVWRVAEVRPHDDPKVEGCLVLDFERPYPETME